MNRPYAAPRLLLSLSLLALLVACGGGSAAPQPDGPLALGLVSGNNQSTVAGVTRLGAPVVGQLVRQPNGRVGFQWVIDPLLPPKAYAQGTVVNGTPVAGAVVCAVSVDPAHALVPFSPCTNTGADGKATFFFTTGTTAGVARAEIRGTVANLPVVTDTARATVLPGAATSYRLAEMPDGNGRGHLGTRRAGDTLDLALYVVRVEDRYKNAVEEWPVVWGFSPDTVAVNSPAGIVPPPLTGSGHKPVIPAGAQALYFRVGTLPAVGFLQWTLAR